MIPYLQIPTHNLFDLIPLQPFGILIGVALLVAYHLARQRAKSVGLNPDFAGDAGVWGAIGGFIVGHIVSVTLYFPERILKNPLTLLAVWDGLSSFGGIFGGVIGVGLFMHRYGLPTIEYVDCLLFGAVPGWIFGRAGCAIVHDHPGTFTNFVLGVRTPPGRAFPWGPPPTPHTSWKRVPPALVARLNRLGARHDLGLYETFFLIVLSGILWAFRRVRPVHGFHTALALLIYSPVRFYFDSLRVADKRYFGMTPGQYFAMGLFALGCFLLVRGRKLRERGYAPGLQPAGKGPPWRHQEAETVE